MRIGFDAKRYFFNRTGLGNYSRDLVRILESYFPENTYLKYTSKLPKNSRLTADVRLPQINFDRFFPSLWRQKWISKDLVKDQIDIFHGLSGEIPMGLKDTAVKSVVTIHDLIFLRYPELYKRIDRTIYNKKFKYAVTNTDKIVAISQQTKQDIIDFYGVASDRIEIIYQGCHPSFKLQKTETEKNKLRKKYNLPEHFILNVGSIEPRKNALKIVQAVENIDIPLLIIGKGTQYADKIKEYIRQKGLENRVFLMQGFTMDELATIYQMADLFVYPSLFEGFGIPIIEALYSGTPVITTHSGVFPEAGGPSSLYIDPDNIEQIRDTIISILQDTTRKHQIAFDGKIYAQQFNDDTLASQWQNLYTNLI